MARIGITYEDVQRAIDTLLQRQEAPSVQKVREVLGTGSFTTISEHLREWRVRKDQRKDEPPARGMPAPLQALTENLWEQAQQAANESLAHYRQLADQQVAEAHEQVTESGRRAEDAEQRESALSGHLARLDERLAEHSAELARSQAELETAYQANEQLQKQVERLSEQASKAQQKMEEREAHFQQRYRELEATKQAQLNQEEKRHEAAEARLMNLLDEARLEYRQAEKAQYAQRNRLEQQLDRTQNELKAQHQALAEAQAEWQRERMLSQQREDAAKTEASRLSAIETARQEDIVTLTERLEQRDAQIEALEGKLQDRLWVSLERVISDADHKAAKED
ncbi:DNA-binding protein [Halomonas halocynthiae]|uniref:DNA-binding protein n=1 Tax=Halomonas halocynthiae TaxID=176290 RepID=UPI000422AF0E|nr:DNA-binding protein [Halomonas halocynthiae]